MLKLTIRWTNSFVVSCCENVSALFLNLLRSLLIIKRKKNISSKKVFLFHTLFLFAKYTELHKDSCEAFSLERENVHDIELGNL